jgi:hypothetical protein
MALDPSQITAVLVTRGDVDLTTILTRFYSRGMCNGGPVFHDVIVYDNSLNMDFKVFSRYLAAQMAHTEYVYVQDDDCLVDLQHYPWDEAGPEHIVCNMPQEYRRNYPGEIQLVGFGAVFPKAMVRTTFERYAQTYLHYHPDFDFSATHMLDHIFLLECDRIFTGLNPCKLVDVPIEHLPWASEDDRLWKQRDHIDRFRAVSERVRYVRSAERK